MTKLRSSKADGTRASALLRRLVRQRREEEEKHFTAMRTENMEKARARRRIQDIARKLRVAREAAKASAKSKKEALAMLPKDFDVNTLGQGHAKGGTRAHCAQRAVCLERLRLRAPPLSRELEAVWGEFKKDYAKWMGRQHVGAVGIRFLEVVRDVMLKLGDHLLNEDGSKAKPSPAALEPVGDALAPSMDDVELVGNADAFAAFIRKARRNLPRIATSLRV